MNVFVVQHVHVLNEDAEDIKLIGVFSSEKMAKEAIKRLSDQPGFKDNLDYTQLLNSITDCRGNIG